MLFNRFTIVWIMCLIACKIKATSIHFPQNELLSNVIIFKKINQGMTFEDVLVASLNISFSIEL